MAAVDMKALLEAGVHFGHRTQKWDPRMKPYIFTERNGIHIIDLQQTVKALEEAYTIVRDLVAGGGTLLFVGTKRQAVETIEAEAQRCEMPYVTVRWLGGMLTNWQTMRQRLNELESLERVSEAPTTSGLTKRELLSNTRKVEKLQDRFGGVRELTRVPDMLFVVDVNRETTAVREANILKIPVLGLVDTNCDPSVIDYVIPSNDDAIRAIKLMVSYIADAALEGSALRQDKQAQEEPKKAVKAAARRRRGEAAVEELTDEELLGSATLAKVAEEQAKVEAEAVAKAAKVAAAPAEAKPKKPAAKKPAKRAAAPKARKPKTKIRKSDLEGEGGDKA
ncbi:MAG TPA: 30S ribosomal protein S2 [Anaerolineales bacterium]|nr:30S ribosomal protein S2 [Anaerolineales bacterium]